MNTNGSPLKSGGFMLGCRELTETVTDYLEGRMRLWDRLRFQFHLGICKGCRTYLDQIRTTIKVTGRLPEAPVPPDVEKALIERFRTWKRTGSGP